MGETSSVPQLLALLEDATPAPWTVRGGGQPTDAHPSGRVPPHVVHIYEDEQGRRCIDFVSGDTRPHDAHVIATLRNEAPEMLRELAALRAQLAKVTEERDAAVRDQEALALGFGRASNERDAALDLLEAWDRAWREGETGPVERTRTLLHDAGRTL